MKPIKGDINTLHPNQLNLCPEKLLRHNWLCTERARVVTNELDEPLVVGIEKCLGPFGTLEAATLHHCKSELAVLLESPFSEPFCYTKYSTQCKQIYQPILATSAEECHGTGLESK